MWHYDASSSDAGGLGWFKHKDCKMWYTRYYLDNGDIVSISPYDERTAHAGRCITPQANSFFYGLSLATNGITPVTAKQLASITEDTARLFRFHRSTWRDNVARLVGHDEQACYGPEHTLNRARWGKLGRKNDPTGDPARTPNRKPVISMNDARATLARVLTR